MTNKILLIGGGGHCKSVLDSLIRLKDFSEIAIIDTKENFGNEILNKEVIGTDSDLERLFKDGYKNAFITVGSIGDTKLRRKLYNIVSSIGFNIPNIIDSTAILSENIKLGRGIFIGKSSVLNVGTIINDCVIINTGAIIEHDSLIHEFSHIAPGTVICGNVVIEEDVHIGAKSVVRQQVKIGKRAIIGIGSVVTKDIPENSISYGNPCRIKQINLRGSKK